MMKFNKALLGGSIIFLIGSNLYQALNFGFHFCMARMLTPADYGILATLFSIVYMTGIFSESLQTIVAKYSSGEKDNGKLKNLVKRTANKALKISFILFLIYLVAAIALSYILKISYPLVSLTGLIIFAAFLPPITRGTLQGTKRFFSLGINLIIEGFAKLVIAIVLVFFGWKVYGAMTATILSFVIAFIFSVLAIRDVMKSKEKPIKAEGIYSYSLPVFVVLFSILVFYSIDVIIAKIVFDPTTAGYYAIASILAKTIFFGTQPISKVMFPLAAEKKNQKGNHLILNALGLVMICIFAALLMFYFFPDFIIWIFSGKHITESSNILFYLGIAISLLSLTNLTLLYKLSKGKTDKYFIFLIFPLIEVVLLCIFSHNLIEFSIAFITSSAIFLWGAIFFLGD